MSYHPNSKWIPYTTTCSHTSNTTVSAWYKRNGDSIDIRLAIFYSDSPGTPGTLTFTIPEGLSIDTNKTGGDAAMNCATGGYINDATTAYLGPLAVGGSSDTLSVYYRNPSNGQFNVVTHAAPITITTNDGIRLTITGLPILEWA